MAIGRGRPLTMPPLLTRGACHTPFTLERPAVRFEWWGRARYDAGLAVAARPLRPGPALWVAGAAELSMHPWRPQTVVRLRLKRFGRRNRPYYRVCAFDQRTRRDGSAIEELGYYDPIEKDPEKAVKLEVERIQYWLRLGAQPSETVRSLIRKAGVEPTPGAKAPGQPSQA